MSEFAEKKALRSQIAAAKKAGKSVQTIGRLQYKLNQLMKTKQKSKPVKRKTPLTGSPSAGTGKKKYTGPDMYAEAVALDKPKLQGKSKGVMSNVTVTPYPKAANKRAGQVRIDASPSGAAASRKLSDKKAAAKKEAKRQNNAIEKMVSRQDAADLRTKRSKTGVDNRKSSELVRQQGSQAGKANSLKLRELKDTMKRMKASGSSASALSNIKAKIAKLQG